MRLICSWCQKKVGEKNPYDDISMIQMICPECYGQVKNDAEPQDVEALEHELLNLKVRVVKKLLERALSDRDLKVKDTSCLRAIRHLILLGEEIQRVKR
jgi:hypothetical protein